MGRTLLIGNPRTTWREWLKEHRRGRDLLCLDPADPQQGVPGRLALFHEEHPIATRFYGSLDAQRSPHVIVSAVASLLPRLGPDGLVQLFAYRATPVLRQTAMIIAELLNPSRIVLARGTGFSTAGLPGEVEEIDLDDAVSPAVQHAQRKAQWLRLVEECESHELDMSQVALEGARLGSGEAIERSNIGLPAAIHVERCGGTLLVVSQLEFEEAEISRALDLSGCNRATVVEPEIYENLLCSFTRVGGEEIGMGLVQKIDWVDRRMYIQCTAVAPTPVAIVRLGSLRVDRDGRELGELRPWQG